MESLLLSKVNEKGIVDIISNYKLQMEYCHIIELYTYNDKVDWGLLSEKEYLDHNFLVLYQDNIQWNFLSFNENIKLDIESYRMFADKFNWRFLEHPLDDEFLTEFQDYVDWYMVSVSVTDPSIEFLEKWKDKLSWNILKQTNKIKDEYLLHFDSYFNFSFHPRKMV